MERSDINILKHSVKITEYVPVDVQPIPMGILSACSLDAQSIA